MAGVKENIDEPKNNTLDEELEFLTGNQVGGYNEKTIKALDSRKKDEDDDDDIEDEDDLKDDIEKEEDFYEEDFDFDEDDDDLLGDDEIPYN